MKKLILFMAMAGAMGVWPRRALSHETLTTTVLFDREIVRILDKHCVMCHVENGPSFPLETYEQTWLQKRKIRADVIARHMPPWSPVPGYGQFVNDNSLTLRESQFIVSWVEGLGPRNAGRVFTNVADAEAKQPQEVRAHIDFGTWELGKPSLTVSLPPNTIESDGIQRSVIDLGLKSERQLRGLEFMPGDRRVVRAAFFTLQETGQWIGSWTPWYGYVSLPKGSAYRLPAGSHIVAEIHYQGMKERVGEHGSLGLFFADAGAAANSVSDLVLENKGDVAPGASSQRFRAQTRVTADTSIWALRPELQPGVKSVEVSARKPDGGTEVLLFAKDLALDWPTPYILKQPVVLPRGTELFVTAYYANPGATPHMGGIRLTIAGLRHTF